jgi:hypothetical protein
MKQELSIKPISGYVAVLVAILFLAGAIASFNFEIIWLGAILTILFGFTMKGFVIVEPNGSSVMILFGAYSGECNVEKTAGNCCSGSKVQDR